MGVWVYGSASIQICSSFPVAASCQPPGGSPVCGRDSSGCRTDADRSAEEGRMDDVTRQALRLLEEAQTGGAAGAVAAAEAALRGCTGELVDGPAALHFALAVARYAQGELRESIAGIELLLVAA